MAGDKLKFRGRDRNRGSATRRGEDDDELPEQSTCCGIRWKHLVLLFLFIGPTFLGALFSGAGLLMRVTGWEMPRWLGAEPPGPDHRARLLAFYRKNNPGKIGEVDGLLKKYK